jgi:hypothetical protein
MIFIIKISHIFENINYENFIVIKFILGANK